VIRAGINNKTHSMGNYLFYRRTNRSVSISLRCI